MNSHINKSFRKLLDDLSADVQKQARESFALWKQDHWHNSLQFKQVHPNEPFYSACISRGWRALGYVEDGEITWFWIGSHSEYDNLLKRL